MRSGAIMASVDLLSILKDAFGFDEFRPSQEEVCRSLVEGNHMPLCRNRAQQQRRMGAHDSHIALSLSTAPRGNLDDLDGKEMPDPLDVAIRDRGELSVGGGAGPEEVDLHVWWGVVGETGVVERLMRCEGASVSCQDRI